MQEHRMVELGVERLGTAKGLRGFRSLGGVTGIGASFLVLHRRDDLSNTQARPCSNLGMAGSRSVGPGDVYGLIAQLKQNDLSPTAGWYLAFAALREYT